jgi:hypothetical protein
MDDRPASRGPVTPAIRRRRRVLVGAAAVLVAGLALAAALVYLPGPTSNPPPQPRGQGGATVSHLSTTTATVPPTTSSTTTTTDPGTLAQTDQFPSANTPQFMDAMQSLWNGVVQASVTTALPAFFPQSAYVQLKTGISDPAGDWMNRLVADFGRDIQAAHALIASDPSSASFVGVSVPQQYGHWIPPQVCANGIGYYEVANSRLVYRFQGQLRSFGIASLISWRGEWYVVHLGAILRPSSGGEVDDPEVGPGYSQPSSTC